MTVYRSLMTYCLILASNCFTRFRVKFTDFIREFILNRTKWIGFFGLVRERWDDFLKLHYFELINLGLFGYRTCLRKGRALQQEFWVGKSGVEFCGVSRLCWGYDVLLGYVAETSSARQRASAPPSNRLAPLSSPHSCISPSHMLYFYG